MFLHVRQQLLARLLLDEYEYSLWTIIFSTYCLVLIWHKQTFWLVVKIL